MLWGHVPGKKELGSVEGKFSPEEPPGVSEFAPKLILEWESWSVRSTGPPEQYQHQGSIPAL